VYIKPNKNNGKISNVLVMKKIFKRGLKDEFI